MTPSELLVLSAEYSHTQSGSALGNVWNFWPVLCQKWLILLNWSQWIEPTWRGSGALVVIKNSHKEECSFFSVSMETFLLVTIYPKMVSGKPNLYVCFVSVFRNFICPFCAHLKSILFRHLNIYGVMQWRWTIKKAMTVTKGTTAQNAMVIFHWWYCHC